MNQKKITIFLSSKLNKIKKIDSKFKKNIDKFNFITSGHLDSIELLKFIFQIEKKFKITIKPSETVTKTFGTIKGLRSLILNKLSKISK